jgi:hypothetical protein
VPDIGYFAQDTYGGNGSTQTFAVSFPFLDESHLAVFLDGKRQTSGYSYLNGNIIVAPAPPSGSILRIRRESPDTSGTLLFQPSNPDHIDETDLDLQTRSLLYVAQENRDQQKWHWGVETASFTVEAGDANAWAVDTTPGSVVIHLDSGIPTGTQLIFRKLLGDVNTISFTAGVRVPPTSVLTATEPSVMVVAADGLWVEVGH